MNEIKIFCPATIANLSCGFDVLGTCLDNVGDEMIVRKSEQKGIRITKIVGANLPFETEKNVAGVAALSLLKSIKFVNGKYIPIINDFEVNIANGIDLGFEIEIYKNIKAGSGIGSSAASAAGAVFGINELLGRPYSRKELVKFAMQGEVLASGSAHADNVAPCLLGGFTLVRSSNPLDIIRIESPNELYATVIHPHIELKTSEMREILQPMILLKDAVIQWGNVGGLIAGLYTFDYELIGRSLQDVIVEPLRGKFIPNFEEIKKVALDNGALGSGISGSGPSIFALSKGKFHADKVANLMREVFEKTNIEFDIHVCKINSQGVKVI
ncbi:MAG: homoserine kinase [Flavobacterium sp.]|nr:homoserine kinase [Flavobacterium sp.]